MATAAQVFANRQNSLRSTGPITEEGRAISSRNSQKHGLTSKHIVLPGEDPVEFDALRESLLEDYSPANETERTLVEELAAGSWRLARARRHETAILKKLVGEDCKDPDESFACLFVEKPKEVDRLMRYITTIERSYYRALNKLQTLQKERKKTEAENDYALPWFSDLPSSIGFVSQNGIESVSQDTAQSFEAPEVVPSALQDTEIAAEIAA